jgi:hypothetical protein|tara:strand:- start:413 stop:1489 length:1077 start_codon:yes stop_codon:yes gene_type:complete
MTYQINNNGGNYSRVGIIQRDEDGNALQCPHCDSTHLIKAGTCGTHKQRKRWKCRTCNKKTVSPKIIKNYELEEAENLDWSTEELINARTEVFKRKEAREKSEKFVNIKIDDKKPIGLYIQGDPHVDDDGCDWLSLRKHIDIVNETDGMYACSVGDLSNNWARRGKLAGLWADQTTNGEQQWQLVEWLVNATPYIFIVAGNHDMWAMEGDPINWMCKPLKTVYSNHSARLKIKLPKHEIKVNCSHNFRGHSMYNTAHGIVKHALFNARDHLLIAGHTHVSGYSPIKDANSDKTMHCVQVGSYKKYDNFAKQLNLPCKMMSACAVAVFNTNLTEDHPDFIKIFWEVEEGAEYLNFLRNK